MRLIPAAFALAIATILSLAPAPAKAQGCGQGNPGCVAPTPSTSPCDNSNRIATTAYVQLCGSASPTTPIVPTPTNVFNVYGGCIADWKDNVFACQTPGQPITSYGGYAAMFAGLGGTGTGGAKTCYDQHGVLIYFPANTPAQPCYREDGVFWGLLMENTSKNYLTYSEAFDNAAWTKTNTTIAPDAVVSPDTNRTADILVPTTTNGAHQVAQTSTKSATAQTFTVTCFIAPNVGFYNTMIRVDDGAGNGAYAIFSPADGTEVTSPTGLGTAFTNLQVWTSPAGVDETVFPVVNANTFWRVGFTYTTNTATSIRVVVASTNGTSTSFAGDGVSANTLWGCQNAQFSVGAIETVTQPGSYIPTTSAAVTRLVDQYTMVPPSGMRLMPYGAAAVTSFSGGSGYVAGEQVTMRVGVGCTVPPVFQITTVDGSGAPTAASVIDPGQCLSSVPSDPLNQQFTTGHGVGASFTVGANWQREATLFSDVQYPYTWNNISGAYQVLESTDLTQRLLTLRSSTTSISGQAVNSAGSINILTSGAYNNSFNQEYAIGARLQNANNRVYTSLAFTGRSSLVGFPDDSHPFNIWRFNNYTSNATLSSDPLGHLIEVFYPAGIPDTILSGLATIAPVVNPDLPVSPPGYLTQAMIADVATVGGVPIRVEQTGNMIPTDTPSTDGAYHLPMNLNYVNLGDPQTQATSTATTAKYSFGLWGNKCNAPGGVQSYTVQCPGGYSTTVSGTLYQYMNGNPNSFNPQVFDTNGVQCMALYSTYDKANLGSRVRTDAAFGYPPTNGGGTGYLDRAANDPGAPIVVLDYNTAVSDCASLKEIAEAQTMSGAGNLNLNGSIIVGGSATLRAVAPVKLTSTGNDGAITFTVVGTDASNAPLSEVIAGACGAPAPTCSPSVPTVTTTNSFKTVTQVSASGATAGTIMVGVAPVYFNVACISPSSAQTKCSLDLQVIPKTRPIDGTIVPDGMTCDCEFADGRPTAKTTTVITNLYNDLHNAPASPYTGAPWNNPTPQVPPVGGYKLRIAANNLLTSGGRGGFCGSTAQEPITGCNGQTPNLKNIVDNFTDEINVFFQNPPSAGHTLQSQVPDALCLLTNTMWPCTPSGFPASKVTLQFVLGKWPTGTTPDDATLALQQIQTYSLGGVLLSPLFAPFGGARNSLGVCRWTIQKICNVTGLSCGNCP